ncbi:MAG TPA: ABC transporter transmembrane domain-containing protein [Nitrospiria bacterium]|nr:ABC transporter transmembrane domain-containing protein [Nitrospiria bacterium]
MDLYRRLLTYVLVYWRRLIVVVVSTLIIAAMTASYAWLMKYIQDDVLIGRNLSVLAAVIGAIIVVALVKAAATFAESYTMSYIGIRIGTDIRNHLYRHLLSLPVGYYTGQQTGRILSKVMNDVTIIQMMLTNGLKDAIQQCGTLAVLLIYVFYLNWKLAILAVIVLPAAYLLLMRTTRRIKRLAGSWRDHVAGLTALLQEGLLGHRVIKSFAKEEFAYRQFEQQNEQMFDTLMRLSRISEFVGPVVEVAGVIGIGLLLWTGGYQVANGTITPGEFMSFLTACILLYAPVKRLSTISSQLQPLSVSADRLFSILDVPTETQLDAGRIELKAVRQGIALQQVSFRYGPHHPLALEDVTFTVSAGEMVALVGSSGSGKSTVVNLIARFYEPTSGRIAIDGLDLRDIALPSLRRLIGMVSQDTILFHDTVRNNIAFGRADLPLEAVVAAAKSAHAHSFITALSDGYDTVIGERGLTLSGGERQRLAIARAFLVDPPILILDEATSSLDYESEAMVQQALTDLIKGRTTLVIAHRLSTVQQAHRIVVLKGGRIVEEGRHEQLLQLNGVYRRLYERQFRDEEAEEVAPLGRTEPV